MSKKDDSIEIIVKSKTKAGINTTRIDDIKRIINDQKKDAREVSKAAKKEVGSVAISKQEANRLVSLANKRLRRLEQNNLQNTPAYQGFLKNGGQYFSVRGLSQQELQREMKRLKGFIDGATSTVRGTNLYAKEMAKNTGIKYKNLTELRAITPKFFELTSMIEQYLRNVEDAASAIDYNQIWESVNVYVAENKIDLSKAQGDIDGMIKNVAKALTRFDKTTTVSTGSSFRLKK